MRGFTCILLLSVLLLSGVKGNTHPVSRTVSGQNPFVQRPDTVAGDIKMGRNILYRQGKADAYRMIGEREEENGNLAKALRYYFSAIYELEILDDSLGIADIKSKIGFIFHSNRLHLKALEYYTAAEQIYLRAGMITAHPKLLQRAGQVHFALADYPAAIRYFTRAGTILQGQGADSARMSVLFQTALCFNALNDYERAIAIHAEILAYYQENKDLKNEVIALNNLGYTYKNLGNYNEALNYFNKTASLEISITGSPSPVTLVNQAIVYQNTGNDARAIKMLNEAAKIGNAIKDEQMSAEYNHLTGLVYYNLKDYHNALIYNNTCISLSKKNGYASLLRDAYLLSARIYESMYNYEEAMIDFQKHLNLKDSLQRAHLLKQQELDAMAFNVEVITRETESLWASEELSYLELQRLKLDSANRQQELEILYKADSIQRITIQNQQLENQRARQALLLKEEQVYAAKKAKEVDSLRQIEQIQALELETQQLVQKEQESQIKILDRENQIAELNLKKVKTRNKWLIAFGALALVIIYLVIRGLRYAKKTNRLLVKQNNEIERQRDEIEFERQRSDKLLLNILPEETAEELKEKGSATPRHYEMVTVLFTDFKGFTTIAEKLTPQELVAELDNCFLEFDRIIDRYNLEKIKTIGDAYMCAGGIPVANHSNPLDTVQAAMEIRNYMENLKAEREARGEAFWELRLGIHTGPVIAGVVGKNKFAYDIWGDAVNTASRMESSGIPGKVNISGETYQLIKDRFNCTYRGKVNAKNKGEIDMYIVEGEKTVST